MSVVILLTLKTKPDTFEPMRAMLAEILPDTNAHDGCLGVYACADEQDHSIVLYERWQTEAHHDRYAAWRAERGDSARMGAMLREPPVAATCAEVFA